MRVKGQGSRVKNRKRKNDIFLFLLSALFFTCPLTLAPALSGCGPTYPKESLKESIIKVCKKEYSLDVKVEVIGKTVAIYCALQDLWDFTFAMTKKASEELNDVILTVSRVTLSTDAGVEFYVVIAHDMRLPEIQIIIVKRVEDVKRFMLNDISRGEFSKRMLIDKRINPQAKKEHDIKQVFEKMGLDKKWQDTVMNDFFRAQPAALGDIGYWNDRFYVKDIQLPEFLVEQIAGRVRMDFYEDKKLADTVLIKSAKGSFINKEGKRYFEIDVFGEPKVSGGNLRPDEISTTILKETLKIAAHVIHGYDFKDVDYIIIVDEALGKTLKVSTEDAEKFRKRKMTFDEIASQVDN